jgi:PAS domain-containing protein
MDVLVATHGPWFWLHTTYSYACLLTGSLVLLITVLTRVRPLTGQGIAMVTAVSLPWLANAISLFYREPLAGLDITAPTIVLSGAIVGLSLQRYGALRVFPGLVTPARDAILKSMRDGVLVVSPDGVILSANPSAAEFLGTAERGLLGHAVDTYFPELSWKTFSHGCDCVQGYGLTVPMPADDVLDWVRRRPAGDPESRAGDWQSGARAAERRCPAR